MPSKNVIHAGTFDIWPLIGTIVATVSGEYVLVAWGNERFSTEPRTAMERIDELVPTDLF